MIETNKHSQDVILGRNTKNTLKPLNNTVHYNTILDITRFKDGSQKCIDYVEKWP